MNINECLKVCTGNANTQRALHKYVSFMIDQRIHYPHCDNILPTIISIYKDNISLCTKIGHHANVVRHFRRLVEEKNPLNLEFFKVGSSAKSRSIDRLLQTLLEPSGHV